MPRSLGWILAQWRNPDQRTQARQESQAHRVGDMKRDMFRNLSAGVSLTTSSSTSSRAFPAVGRFGHACDVSTCVALLPFGFRSRRLAIFRHGLRLALAAVVPYSRL